MINLPERKPRIKGLKISQTPEKKPITGDEFLPYQEGEDNGRIQVKEINKLNIFEFSPVIKDGKIRARDYLDILTAIREHKLVYIPKEDGTGKSIATEIRVKAGDIHLELLDYKLEEKKSKIAKIITESVNITSDLDYIRKKHVTPTFTVLGEGKKMLADNGEYISIDDWFLKQVNFANSKGTTATYGLKSKKVVFDQLDTDAVSWDISSNDDGVITLKLKIDLATWDKDGLMARKDKWRLDVKIPDEIQKLKDEDDRRIQEDARLQRELLKYYDKFVDFRAKQSRKNNELSNAIEDEKNRAEEKEQALKKDIEKEAADRKAKDDEYAQKFTDIKDQWVAGDNEVRKYVDELKNQVGKPKGLATLGEDGKVPTDQLPAYVDDVLEFTHKDPAGHEPEEGVTYFPAEGETGKIYVDTTTGKTYRWSGTQYVVISETLALGETDSTAYKGSEGNKNRMALRSLPNTFVTDFVDGSQEYTDEEVKFKYKKSRRKTSTDTEVGTDDDLGLGFTTPQEEEVTIAAATHDKAGVMTALDKNHLDQLQEDLGTIDDVGNKVSTIPKRLMTHIDPVVQEADSVHMEYMTYVQNRDGADRKTASEDIPYVKGKYERQPHTKLTIEGATVDKAGVVRASDYQKLNSIPDDLVSTLDYTTITKSSKEHAETPYDTILIDYKALKREGSGQYHSSGESALEVLKIASTGIPDGDQDGFTPAITKWELSATNDEDDNDILKDPVLTLTHTEVPTKQTFNAEVDRAEKAEKDIEERLAQEVTRATGEEQRLRDMITTETERAQGREADLQKAIEDGAAGAKGDRGETGPAGPAGPQGPKGKVWWPSYSNGGSISWTLKDESSSSSVSADFATYFVKKSGDTMTGSLTINSTNGNSVTAPHFYKSSDARLKTSIQPLSHTLDQICSIPTISFDLNNDHRIGTTAQALEELGFNELVTESETLKSEIANPKAFESFTKDDKEYVMVKKVEYDNLSVLAIEGIKLLKAEIDKLKEELRHG